MLILSFVSSKFKLKSSRNNTANYPPNESKLIIIIIKIPSPQFGHPEIEEIENC